MNQDHVLDKLKNLKKLEQVLISKRILFMKIGIMYGKGEFSKIKGSICNVTIKNCKYIQHFTKVSSHQWINHR